MTKKQIKEGDVVMILRDDVPGVPANRGWYGQLGVVVHIDYISSITVGSDDWEVWSWDKSELELMP